jgi:myosin-5
MASTYARGTQVWLADSSTSWQPATVSSITLPEDATNGAGEVTLVVTLDKGDRDETRTLKFPLAALNAAAEGSAGAGAVASSSSSSAAAAVAGQELVPPLRNPPVLESAEDLSALSNLNEPSGEWPRRSAG